MQSWPALWTGLRGKQWWRALLERLILPFKVLWLHVPACNQAEQPLLTDGQQHSVLRPEMYDLAS